jgi:hypothetical protein
MMTGELMGRRAKADDAHMPFNHSTSHSFRPIHRSIDDDLGIAFHNINQLCQGFNDLGIAFHNINQLCQWFIGSCPEAFGAQILMIPNGIIRK